MQISSRKLAPATLVLTAAAVVMGVLISRSPRPVEAPPGVPQSSEPSSSSADSIADPVLLGPAHEGGRELLGVASDEPEGAVEAPSCVVEVFVRDAITDFPIGGAAVSCDGEPAAETDSTGRGRFPADRGRWLVVRATAPGRCPGIDRVRAEPGMERVDASITLLPEAAVHGLVRGPDGAPAQGAEVVIHLYSPGLVRPVAPGVDGLASGARTRTDAEGAFRFGSIGSKRGLWRARVVVLHDGCARFESERFDLRNGEEVGPLLCDLEEGARIRGRVTSSGVGARGTVFLEGVGEPVGTDAAGGYELLHVPPGPGTLCASLDAHPGIRTSIALDIRPGEERVQDIALDYELGAFTGVVSTPDGVPLAGVQVWCEMERFGPHDPARYATRARSDGTYRLEVPVQLPEAERAYTLQLKRWEDDCAVAASPPPWIVDFACTASASVVLTAVDRADGHPLEQLYDAFWVPEADPGAASMLLDYENRTDGRFLVAVPVGAGELFLGSYGLVRRGLPLTTYSGEYVDLGRVEFDTEH